MATRYLIYYVHLWHCFLLWVVSCLMSSASPFHNECIYDVCHPPQSPFQVKIFIIPSYKIVGCTMSYAYLQVGDELEVVEDLTKNTTMKKLPLAHTMFVVNHNSISCIHYAILLFTLIYISCPFSLLQLHKWQIKTKGWFSFYSETFLYLQCPISAKWWD